jgi:hypothetical protein
VGPSFVKPATQPDGGPPGFGEVFQDIPARHTQGADHQGAGIELVDPHRRSKALVDLCVHAYLVSRMGDVSRLDDLFSDVNHPCGASFMPFGHRCL